MGKWVQVLLSGSNVEVKGIKFNPTNTVAGSYKTVYYNTSTKELFASGNLQGLNYVTGDTGDEGLQGQQGTASPNVGLQGVSSQGAEGTIPDPFEGDVRLTLPSNATGVTRSLTIGKDRSAAASSTLARVIFETDPSAGGVGETQLFAGGASISDGNSVIYHKGTEDIVFYVTGSTSNHTTQVSPYVRFVTGNPPSADVGGSINNLTQNNSGFLDINAETGEFFLIRGLPYPGDAFDPLDRNGIVEGIQYRHLTNGQGTSFPYFVSTQFKTSFGDADVKTSVVQTGTVLTGSFGGPTDNLGLENLSVNDLVPSAFSPNFGLEFINQNTSTGNSVRHIGTWDPTNDNLRFPAIKFYTRVLNNAFRVQRESTGIDLFNITKAGRIYFNSLTSTVYDSFCVFTNPITGDGEICNFFFSTKKTKKDIKPSSDELLQGFEKLRPVTYEYKHYKDSKRFGGFIAEECAQANPLFAKYGPNYKIDPHKGFSYNEKPINDDIVPVDIESRAIMASAVAKLHQLEEELNYL